MRNILTGICIFAMNFSPHIPMGEIQGMAVFHHGIPYTLNYKQQILVVKALESAQKITHLHPADISSFDKVIIYRFNLPEIEILPHSSLDQNLIFSVSRLDPPLYFIEHSEGELLKMLNASFD